ncbi:uncharacterized protein LOC132062031 [Lycium ferocissimum]|uniref:uncharacterized protein LOC132062031 n=1 Tax=Lycium ferocissimum TaxID=112874 RepID=UPI002814AFD2|nr:uncharacterized protein LOC132062031 [Lycium ferocissimum]
MIAHVCYLNTLRKLPRMPIKTCISMVHSKYGKIISKRKRFLGRKRAFETIFGTWESSFQAFPGYMAALKHANPGIVVQWRLLEGRIFDFVFWAFKPSIDGFARC